MEAMTINVKTKKTKRIIEDLEALDVLNIVKKENHPKPRAGKLLNGSENKIALNWLPTNHQGHAREILDAYHQAKEALEKNIPLKSAKEFLNEL
jgi:hypothetical protein